jgi:multiple sugar transport system substrate-binding protein
MSRKSELVLPLILVLSILFSACNLPLLSQPANSGGPTTITLFFHSGQGPERDALDVTLNAFNESHPDIQVSAVQLPEGRYTDEINIAAMAHSLPCLLDFDGPTLYNYAWSGYLLPLDKYITSEMKADFLPSIIQQGTYNHHLYSLGQFDSGLGIYANKQYLSEAGVRIPTLDNPWTLNEFNDALAKLKHIPGVQYPLDLHMSDGYGDGEWFTYGFSPFIESFGGDLINRSNYQSASGVLNGPAAIAAMKWFQGLFKQGYSNPWPADDSDFTSGRAALSWVGHWVYLDYRQALGDNLLVLPAPNLGKGAKTGMGSWNWGITSSCKNPDAAWKVLQFLLSPSEIARMADANGAIPARKSVIAQSHLYAANGPLHVFVEQLQMGRAEPRPITPAYPAITSAFAEAVANIAAGEDVKKELDNAVKKINQDIQDNQGYPTR